MREYWIVVLEIIERRQICLWKKQLCEGVLKLNFLSYYKD